MKKSRDRQPTYKPETTPESTRPKLEIVIKCDSSGSVEAVNTAVLGVNVQDVDIRIIYSGVGDIHKSDILMADTGSRLIAGFQVGVMPGMDKLLREYGVEVRLYDVIYKLTSDIENIAVSMAPHVPEEQITGAARIIALFKSSRKGIIIGCEVSGGYLSHGQRFRIISAMGPVYTGTIDSMKIEKDAVQKALPGQQVGIKITDFNRAKVGDLVESFRPPDLKDTRHWKPGGEIIRKF